MGAAEGTNEVSDYDAMPDFNEETPGEKMDTTADFDSDLNKFVKSEPNPCHEEANRRFYSTF